MREIKFRAWIHRDCGGTTPIEMYESYDYSDNYGLYAFFELYHPIFFTIEQFTGLKDSKGQEIYEGDIISYTQHRFNTTPIDGRLKAVKWDRDRWNIHSTNAGESNIEVIGNIHENPELLTQKD